jgi:chemotaxis protein CheX
LGAKIMTVSQRTGVRHYCKEQSVPTATEPTQQQPSQAASAPRLSAKLILPFVESTKDVFAKMVGVKAVTQAPRLKDSPGTSYDVSGIIGFSGDLVGSVVVSFQMQTARKLVASFVGMDLDPATPDFADAIGELANMIAGSAKKDLSGLTANITVPTVIIGAGHMVARLNGVPCIVIPCRTPVGELAVEVNIKPTAAPASK